MTAFFPLKIYFQHELCGQSVTREGRKSTNAHVFFEKEENKLYVEMFISCCTIFFCVSGVCVRNSCLFPLALKRNALKKNL